MSTYYYGACHTCKQYIDASNNGIDNAEQITSEWASANGHERHDISVFCEYEDECDRVIYGANKYEDVTA